MSYVEIPAERCEADADAVIRAIYDIEDLKNSIEKVGQLEPVLAYQKNGKYYVYVGVRRLFAIKELAREGKLNKVKAILTEEPAGEEKYRKIYEENAVRSEMTLYDKIYAVWIGSPLVEELVKHRDISEHFVREARRVKDRISVEELRRWYGIEKALGARQLTIDHIALLGDARKEIRDYAVFVFVSLKVPAKIVSNLEIFLASVRADDARARSLGIERPAFNVPANEPALMRPLLPEERKLVERLEREKRASKEENQPEEGAEPEEEEEPAEQAEEVPVLLIYDYDVVREPGKVVILYAKEEPRVEMKKVEEGEVVEKDGKRYRVRVQAGA